MIKLLCVDGRPEWRLFEGKTYTFAGQFYPKCNCWQRNRHPYPYGVMVSELPRPYDWVMACHWCRIDSEPQPALLPFHPNRFIQINDPEAERVITVGEEIRSLLQRSST